MIEEIMYIISLVAPPVAAVGGVTLSALLIIRECKKAIDFFVNVVREFMQSNELKKNNEQISQLLKDNKDLKKMNEKLLVELTRIKPKEWTDDEK